MSHATPTTVEPAATNESALLANLMQFYLHDMSEAFPIELGPDGKYEYGPLPSYWSEPDRRMPFLVRTGRRVAGFALVTVGSPASTDPSVFDLTEFFVLRQHRRTGVGRQAACALFERLGGKWIVRVSERNPAAVRFWSAVLSEFTAGRMTESTYKGSMSTMSVFAFSARA